MASVEELQEELVRQSSRRLEAEHDRMRINELWRNATKENTALTSEITSLKSENSALALRLQNMENELADLSSSLLEQANKQVAEANRRAAAAHKLVEERDDVIGFQEAQLQALKEMLERNEEENNQSRNISASRQSSKLADSHDSNNKSTGVIDPERSCESLVISGPRIKAPSLPGELNRLLVLDLDAYASPLRPIIRTDLREFKDFMLLWGVERNVHPTMFAKLEAPPWRRTKFVQRAIQDDIEPTLRLDRTPHMSWLSSRAFLNGVLDQTLALEPVSAKELPWAQRPSHPCLLCGETRGDDIYARTFWAHPTEDSDSIVLDLTCVVKTRLVCEFVAFLRNIASRPPADEFENIRAWRQCNSMREQLFWVRTGGLFPKTEEALAALQSSTADDFDFDVEIEPIPRESSQDRNGKMNEQLNQPKRQMNNTQTDNIRTPPSSSLNAQHAPTEMPTPSLTPKNPVPIASQNPTDRHMSDDNNRFTTPPLDTLSVVPAASSEVKKDEKTIDDEKADETQLVPQQTMPGGWPS